MSIKVQKKEYVEEQGAVLEDGERYPATLTGFGEMEGQFGARLVWQFEVEDGKDAVEAAAFSSYSMAAGKKKSNLIAWTEAMLGDIPDEGVDLDDLIGKPCRVEIETYTKENGITKNKVTKVVAPKKGQKGRVVEQKDNKPAPPDEKTDIEVTEEDFNDIPF